MLLANRDRPNKMRIEYKQMLEQQKFMVIPAGTPQEAILIAEKHRECIDLLLTDVFMPEMNGNNLADKLRVTSPNLKTLFISGYTTNIITSHEVFEDGVKFIQKPFSIKTLMSYSILAIADCAAPDSCGKVRQHTSSP